MAEAVAFYQGLGFQLLYGGPQALFTSFQVGDGYLNLQAGPVSGPPPREQVWGRIIFWVDDVDAMHQRALQAGYRPATAPADAPWGSATFTSGIPTGTK